MDFIGFRKTDDEVMREAIMSSGMDEVDLPDGRVRSMTATLLYVVAGIAVCIAVWWVFAGAYNHWFARSILFPTPPECFARLAEFLVGDVSVLGSDILVHMSYSLRRWAEGFLIALLIGAAIGIAMGRSDRIYRLGTVPINILQMIPGLAWYPVCILLFGLGETSALFIISVTAISPIAISISAGLRRVPKVNLRVAQMCGKSRADTFLEVLLPFAAIDFINGIRIGMANAWRMLISAEMVVGVAVGLGYAIQIETAYLDYVTAFACIVLICIIGLIVDKLVLANIESYASRRLGMEASS